MVAEISSVVKAFLYSKALKYLSLVCTKPISDYFSAYFVLAPCDLIPMLTLNRRSKRTHRGHFRFLRARLARSFSFRSLWTCLEIPFKSKFWGLLQTSHLLPAVKFILSGEKVSYLLNSKGHNKKDRPRDWPFSAFSVTHHLQIFPARNILPVVLWGDSLVITLVGCFDFSVVSILFYRKGSFLIETLWPEGHCWHSSECTNI